MTAATLTYQLSVYADDNRPVVALPLDPRCVSVTVATTEPAAVRLDHVAGCGCGTPLMHAGVDTVPAPRAPRDDR